MTFGLTAQGFKAKRLVDIQTDLENQLLAEFGDINLDPQSIFGQQIGVFSKVLADLWENMEDVYFSQYPNFAEGISLDKPSYKEALMLTSQIRSGPRNQQVSKRSGILRLPSPTHKATSKSSILAAPPQFRRNSHLDNVWASANIPMLEANLTIELPVLGGLFRQRYRGEYVSFNTKHFHDHGLFRYRMYYFTPWRLGRVEFNPWVSNEFFFRQTTRRGGAIIQQGNWYENRFRIGANARLTKNLFIDLYWQWRTLRQMPGFYPNWANTYQIGVNSIYMF